MSKKKNKEPPVKNLVVISDTHCGCQLALCPSKIRLDNGGTYHASRFQTEILTCWNYFWTQWVPQVTRGEPFAVVLNGDAMDGRHHGATTPISQNLSDQANIAYEMLAPVVEACEGRFYFIRGTRSHTGEAGENEEKLAERLNAIVDEETGNRSRFEMWARLGGQCLVHLTHHIGVTSSMAYQTTAPMKELTEMFSEAGRWQEEPPDVLVRSHRHKPMKVDVPTARGSGIVVVTPGWQLKTPFLFTKPGGRVTTPELGGALVRQGDEEHFVRMQSWKTKRSKQVIL